MLTAAILAAGMLLGRGFLDMLRTSIIRQSLYVAYARHDAVSGEPRSGLLLCQFAGRCWHC